MKKAAKRGESPMWALSEEASRLISASVGTRDEAPVTLAVRSEVRQGELAALRWDDLDFSDMGMITVRRSADTRTKTVVFSTKTG